ncbi:LysR family transcriptional regulator ArgP [Undibacterium sp. Di27W]|uniref:LysR family transcriptional regulator ArgP n=1 Tax=Undibacterium sp. Di27W TaxID=3413036 RepID=UPI003BF086C0
MSTIDYRGLAALDAIIGTGSFERAALALSISQPAVSHRLRALEESAGALLVIRSHPPQATEQGQRLIAHYRQVRLLEASLRPGPGAPAELPQLGIAVNADSAATWFPEALAPLLTPPSCLIDIRIDDQEHTLRHLCEGRVVACVTSAREVIAGADMTPLGIMRYHCVAAPSFARHWMPQGLSVEAVSRAPALIYNKSDALHDSFLRQQLGWKGGYPHHTFATSEGFVRFIEAGHAYGMVPALQARASLASGALCELVPGVSFDVPLAWYCWSIQTALTRNLTASVVETAARWLV